MGRTLLIGDSSTSWREWLKDNRGKRDLLCLDPSDPAQAPPGRLCLFKGEKPAASRFYGSLDAQRAPHVLLTALAQHLQVASNDAIVQLFAYRSTPLLRHLTMLVAQIVQPEAILMPKGAAIEQDGFPVGPEEVELEAAFPPMVQAAQRKAQWMRLIETCIEQEISLDGLSFEGSRLGAGTRLPSDALTKVGLTDILQAETSAGTLFLVANEEPDENRVGRALDVFHCSRVSIASPDDYSNLLCSFARQSGEDFGIGLVQKVDFELRKATVLCTAVPPAPVRILRLGALRVDRQGNELGEIRPWQV